MPGPTTEALDADLKDVTRTAHRTEAEVSFFKWIFGALLVTALAGLSNNIWTTATLTNQVKNLEVHGDKSDARLDKIETRLGQIETHLGVLDSRMGVLDDRMNRMEGLLKQILDRLPPAKP